MVSFSGKTRHLQRHIKTIFGYMAILAVSECMFQWHLKPSHGGARGSENIQYLIPLVKAYLRFLKMFCF